MSRIFYRCVDWNPEGEEEDTEQEVASFTDAWIETDKEGEVSVANKVASFTDAWIETYW